MGRRRFSRTIARARDVGELRLLPVVGRTDSPVVLGDIATVTDGEEEPRSLSRFNGRNAVALVIQKQSGSNTVAVVDNLNARLADLRRTLPGLAVGLAGTGVLAGVLRSNRHLLWPAETVVSKTADRDWTGELIDRGFVTSTGERVSDIACTDDSCGRTDAVSFYADYHPSSHFWPLQLVETAIVLTATALLVWAAFRLLRRRTGGTV